VSQAAAYATDRTAGTAGTGTKGYYHSTAGTKRYYNKAARPLRETAVAPHRSGLAATARSLLESACRFRCAAIYRDRIRPLRPNGADSRHSCGGGRAGLRASLVRRTCARSCSTCRESCPSAHRARGQCSEWLHQDWLAGRQDCARTSPSDQTRPDQTRPDQTRPDQTRPDQTRQGARRARLARSL
jgi:hypothetical protein